MSPVLPEQKTQQPHPGQRKAGKSEAGTAAPFQNDPEGVQAEGILQSVCLGKRLEVKYVLDIRDFPGDPYEDRIVHDAERILKDPEVEIICETMGGIEPAYTYSKRALEAGKSVCTSIDSQVCHGIPSETVVLKDGDIINVDVSTILDGYFSDSSRMFLIGDVSEEKKRLVRVTKEAVELGLKEVKPWGFLGDMGQAVHDHVKKNGYSVVEDVGGHGVGLEFHEDPFVSYVTKRGTEMVMAPGMIFTIEPMVNMGTSEIYVDDSNGWTIYTEDGKPSAQWEIMVLVTETGHEVLAW